MDGKSYTITPGHFGDVECETFDEGHATEERRVLCVRQDYDVLEILQYLNMCESGIDSTFPSTAEYIFYAYLVLAKAYLNGEEHGGIDLIKALHLLLGRYDVIIFALSDLCLPITSELARAGLKIPPIFDEALAEIFYDAPSMVDNFDQMFPEGEYGNDIWYVTWEFVEHESVDDLIEIISSIPTSNGLISELYEDTLATSNKLREE